jgi:hypothetical protein
MIIRRILHFIKSSIILSVIIVLFGLAILAGTFALGVFVGYHKARFSYQWGDNYHRNFGGPKHGFMRFMDFGRGDFIESHGVAGTIIKTDQGSLVIKGRDNMERVVAIKDDTIIRRGRENIKADDMKTGDFAVIIGEPDQSGQIEAKFIRLMPSLNASIQPGI